MTGTVGILNVGAGDTKLTFDKNNPAERIRAARIVKDMIRRGYALLIETSRDAEDRPVYQRATDFDEKTCEYIIADFDPVRNSFYSSKLSADIVVFEKDGQIDWGPIPAVHHFRHELSTLGCSFAWGVKQENRALQLLAQHVTPVQLKQYLLVGAFLETSKRSRISYMFRKLRPTVALCRHPKRDELRILCALCMHPIAYYAGSWAGAMCPTDDVIAHLMLMRGDEAMFWKRSNQHPPHRPEAGL